MCLCQFDIFNRITLLMIQGSEATNCNKQQAPLNHSVFVGGFGGGGSLTSHPSLEQQTNDYELL